MSGLVLFTLGIFLIGDQRQAFGRHLVVYAEFANLDGITKGTTVQVSGMNAGEVVDIAVPDRANSKFRLRLRLDYHLHALVRTDSLVTIETEGVVGDQYLLVHQGSPLAAEIDPMGTLPSREPLDLADLMDKSAGLLQGASGAMTGIAAKVNGALDAITSAARNTNEVVSGLRQGKGAAGMLLHDDATAAKIRQSVENMRQASADLSHASSQADALVSDLRSRELGQKIDDVMAGAKSAAQNIDATSGQVRQTVAQVLEPDKTGVEATTNMQQSISNLDEAAGNLADDTEALKHNFFLRGFFKRRGYFNLAHLAPDQYRHDRRFVSSASAREWFAGEELFQPAPAGLETLSPAGKTRLDDLMRRRGDSIVESPIVVEGYSASASEEERLAVSRRRAILVRQYLQTHFYLDVQNIGVVSLRDVPPSGVQKSSWDGICIVILK